MTILQKYEKALEVAKNNEKLQCMVIQIQQTIEKLKGEGYIPTPVEEVWVEYFLEKNCIEISLEQAIDIISNRIADMTGKSADDVAFEDLKMAIQALEKQIRLREWIEQQKQQDPHAGTTRQSIINMMTEQFMIEGE